MKLLFAVLSLCIATTAAAQDALNPARQLYAAADYEGALAALERVSPGAENASAVAKEVEKYRVLCLMALGRTAEADAAIEQMLKMDPLYEPSLSDAPPRIRVAFTRVRDRVLPAIARASYYEGKAAFDNKAFDVAVSKLEETLRILDRTAQGNEGDLADLRTLTKGFLDLSRASLATGLPAKPATNASSAAAVVDVSAPPSAPAPAARPPAPAPAPAAAAAPASGGASVPSAAAVPASASGDSSTDAAPLPSPVPDRDPVAVQQVAPPFSYDSLPARSRVEYRGVIEVEIDEKGRVVDVQITRPIHPLYDPVLMKAAREWTYLPAYRDGKPIPVRKRVAVVLRPR
jgi:tetratricopeptide (TPR) repeat protein